MTRARDVANLIGSGNYSSTTFTATAGQTAFTIAHTQGFVQVFMNGLLLDETADYTSNGTAITLTSGAAAGDEIEVVKYNTFSVGDAIPASGGTFTGSIDASAGLITPAGHVIQVVQVITTAQQTIATGSADNSNFTGIGLSLSITPSATSSKVYLMASVSVGQTENAYNNSLGLFRGSTIIGAGLTSGVDSYAVNASWRAFNEYAMSQLPINFLDSPSTTSAITYSVKCNSNGGSTYPSYINRSKYGNTFGGNPSSTLIAMEIAQ